MKQMLDDYSMRSDILTMYCDNSSTIDISKNFVQHSHAKHIDNRHHFIRNLVERKIILIDDIATKNQLADIFIKALDFICFDTLRKSFGLCAIWKL